MIVEINSELTGGQMKGSAKKEKDSRSHYFMMGKKIANMEQAKKETEQGVQLTMLMQAQLNQAQMELAKMLNELDIRMSAMQGPIAQPPIPAAPPDMGMAAPPDMMAAPPDIGMAAPPPDMGGGMMPPPEVMY